MAIEVSTMAAILDFRNIPKWPKWYFGQLLIALRVEIELRFALRSTVSEIMAIEVLILAAILDLSKYLKMAKMAFWAIAYCPLGRNRAPFCPTIDGFRDNGNQSFDPGGHLGFFKISQNGQNGILGSCLLPSRSKLSFVSHGQWLQIEVSTLAAILDFFKSSQNGQNGNLGKCLFPSGSKSSSVSLYDRRFPR